MSNNYSVSAMPLLGRPAQQLVGIYGQVNSTFVFIIVYQSGLDQAFAQGGLPAIQAYVGPLMLFAATALYASYGDQNPTTHSSSSIPAPSGLGSYANNPGSWTV